MKNLDEAVFNELGWGAESPWRNPHKHRFQNLEAAQAFLKAGQVEAKRRFRQLAKDLHPDRNGGDPEKTRRFAILSNHMEEIDRIQVVVQAPPPPPPPPPVIRVVITWETSNTGANSTGGWSRYGR